MYDILKLIMLCLFSILLLLVQVILKVLIEVNGWVDKCSNKGWLLLSDVINTEAVQ